MGAATSINCVSTKNIYISHDKSEKNNVYLRALRDNLMTAGFNVIYSEITCDSFDKLSASEISTHIEHILKHTFYFILCVSEKTFRSYHQTIEINSALDSKKEILYLMMDKNITPLNNFYVKSIVKINKWMRFYTDEQVIDSFNYLLDLSENI
jgi:phosphopantetheine adenylyltransferase